MGLKQTNKQTNKQKKQRVEGQRYKLTENQKQNLGFKGFEKTKDNGTKSKREFCPCYLIFI